MKSLTAPSWPSVAVNRNPGGVRLAWDGEVPFFLSFLEVCAEKGIEPRRHFSGKFNLRISPELHKKLAIAAQARGKSINALAREALQERFA